jgi:6-phosphofructokinase 1
LKIARWREKMKHIAVVTSGGDAPGMNAAIRAVVRSGLGEGLEVSVVRNGYLGLISGTIESFGARDVGGIIQQGGTILGSSRCPEFHTEEGRMKALRSLNERMIDALIVIGGNGSQAGAYALSTMGFPVVGIASTIDNDLYGSEMTIGVDTALNVALEAIDRLKVTASSHHRAFILEVMGRDCGYLALMSGIAGGAEIIIIPEVESNPEDIAKEIRNSYTRGKAHALIVTAEGSKYNAKGLTEYFGSHDRVGFETRVTILGHVQRGAAPKAFDRTLATQFGAGAVQQIKKGNCGVLVGLIKGQISTTPLAEVCSQKKKLNLSLLELARIMEK